MVRRPPVALVPLDPARGPVLLRPGRTRVGRSEVVLGPGALAVREPGAGSPPRPVVVDGATRVDGRWWVVAPLAPVGEPPERHGIRRVLPEVVARPPAPRLAASPPDDRARTSLAPVIVPAVLGVAIGALVRPELALLALVAPAGTLVARLQEGRRRGTTRREAERAVHRAMATHRVDDRRWADDAAGRLRLRAPGGGWAAWVCRRRLPELWGRRPEHDDAWEVRLGTIGGPHGTSVPCTVRLGPGTTVALVGPLDRAVALVRSIVVQLVAAHGPDELGILVADESGPDRPAPTAPLATLVGAISRIPHAAGPPAPGRARHVLRIACGSSPPDPATSLGGATVLVADRVDVRGAPADVVVRIGVPGATSAVLGDRTVRLEPDGLDERTALRALRSLWSADRPSDAGTPDGLLGGGGVPEVVRTWDAARRRAGRDLRVAVGRGSDGPWTVDLVADGPHALIGGTTGSGKSGLLRALALGLACAHPPDDVVLLLVDYKGGATFDGLASLPHVVGVLTDLDRSLAARALRCLTAEVRRREEVLRASGAPDLPEHRERLGCSATGSSDALPRLVVLVDELAALVDDQPELSAALGQIAQRGRSLGVHLVLATQRPSGVVRADLRANANLRIALRVLDPGDSVDVVGIDDAARIPVGAPGRALVRRAGEPATAVDVRAPSEGEVAGVVEVLRDAWAHLGGGRPRSPWPPPLPETLRWAPGAVGLVDEPELQRVRPWCPDPASVVVLIGPSDAGTGPALRAMLAEVSTGAPARPEVVALDGVGAITGAEVSAGVVHLVGPGDMEGRWRAIRALRDLLDRRAARVPEPGGRTSPTVLVVVSGLGTLLAADDPVDAEGLRSVLTRLAAEGPAMGIGLWVVADRESVVPSAVLAAAAEVLLVGGGPPAAGAPWPAGRARHGRTGHLLQLATEVPPLPCPPLPRPIVPGTTGALLAVRRLPATVGLADLVRLDEDHPEPGGSQLVDHDWRATIGVDDESLGPARITVGGGCPALVLGPPGPLRSAVLAAVEAAAHRAGAAVVRAGRSPGAASDDPAGVGRPVVVIVDHADRLDDPDGSLARRLTDPSALVVAAARVEGLRGRYDPVAVALRRARTGVLLPPWGEADGDLLGVVVPRRRRPGAPPDLALLVAHGRVQMVRTPATASQGDEGLGA